MKANYLASPPLVVAYALAGRMDLDLDHRAARRGLRRRAGLPARHLARPGRGEGAGRRRSIASEMFTRNYGEVMKGDENWNAVEVPEGDRYTWPDSTYVQAPSFFEGMPAEPPGVEPIEDGAGARPARRLDHHRPHLSGRGDQKGQPRRQVADRAGCGAARLQLIRLAARQPRGDDPRNLREHPPPATSWSSERAGSPGTFPTARRCRSSTRRWPTRRRACRWSSSPARSTGPAPRATGRRRGRKLLGVRAVIAESFERIHRSNLIGMGVLPLQFPTGESVASLGLTGEEVIDVGDLEDGEAPTRHGVAPGARAATRSSSRRPSGSTPRTRSPTSATAGSCRRC